MCIRDRPGAVEGDIARIVSVIQSPLGKISYLVCSRQSTLNHARKDLLALEAIGRNVCQVVGRDLLAALPVAERGSRTGHPIRSNTRTHKSNLRFDTVG